MIFNQVVSGGGGSSIPTYIAPKNNVNGTYGPDNTATTFDLNGATVVAQNALPFAFLNCTNLTSINLSNLENANPYAFQSCFEGCTGITGIINLSKLNSIGSGAFQSAFKGCTGITGVNLSSLVVCTSTVVLKEAFKNCTGITSVDLSSFERIAGNNAFEGTFNGCTNLTTAKIDNWYQAYNNSCYNMFSSTGLNTFYFKSLRVLSNVNALRSMFANCLSLQSLWFYALDTSSFGTQTNQFNTMLSGCSNVTVHFPMAIQSTIGSWSDVTAGFGGTNTTVLFDLVTSLTGADSNTYTRSEKDSTATATAWSYNDTLYYTSGVSDNTNGVNEPSVGDTIYSDAACTTSLTTITAIA